MPPLLISAAFETDSYSIHLTDLTNIWVESLDHAAILERAQEENTSIDPSDRSQLLILLQKLGLALSSGPKTTLNLSIDSNPGRERPTITLYLTVELPGGLAPLEWPIHLAAVPQTVLTNQLTIPLLLAQHARNREIEGLEEVLKEKDHVIQKLLDKLEAQATDLGQVFPQATAKGGRKVDRARVLEKVRGVAPFDMTSWRRDLRVDGGRPDDTAQLVQQLFEGGATFEQAIGNGVKEPTWWWKIKSSSIVKAKDKDSPSRTKAPPKPSLIPQESTEDNDAFQVQSTPPRDPQESKTSQSRILDDSTGEEDLDAPSQVTKITDSHSSQPPDQKSTPKAAEKRNKIGEKRIRPKQPSSGEGDSTSDGEIAAPKPAKRLGNIRGKKSSELPAKDDSTDDDELLPPISSKKYGKSRGMQATVPPKVLAPPSAEEEATTEDEQSPPAQSQSPSQSPSPPPRSAAKPKKGKLGQIGGKKAAPPPSSPSPQRLPSPAEPPKSKKGKLGQIGGKKKEGTPTPPVSDPAPQRDVTPKRKLGVIGGRSKSSHQENGDAAEEEDGDKGREKSVKEGREKKPPLETSEERAAKKRLQLKRELEEKANAPVKKKRKL